MNMNVLFRMIMFVILAFSLVGCSDDEELIVLPVNVSFATLTNQICILRLKTGNNF